MSRLHVGTSGWGYPSWQPDFYPAGIDRSEFLSFYAGRLDTVELNATKYRLPAEEQFRSWAEQVPDGFRFAVKAPDGIERRLATFEERVRCLGDRLGCVRVVVERPRDDGFLELLLGIGGSGDRYALICETRAGTVSKGVSPKRVPCGSTTRVVARRVARTSVSGNLRYSRRRASKRWRRSSRARAKRTDVVA